MKSFRHNPVPMVLLRLRPAAISQEIHTHTHLHIAPAIHLTSVTSFADTGTLRIHRVIEPAGGERIVHREEMVRRIFEQTTRREAGASGGGATAAVRTPVAFEPRPVPAVLLRSSSRAPQPETAATEPAEPALQTVPHTTRPPALDIERLTDRIVNNIDRRLQAHRERLGRQ